MCSKRPEFGLHEQYSIEVRAGRQGFQPGVVCSTVRPAVEAISNGMRQADLGEPSLAGAGCPARAHKGRGSTRRRPSDRGSGVGARERKRVRMPIVNLHGWGRHPRTRSEVFRPERIREASLPRKAPLIARGCGRAYGDAATLDGGTVLLTERLNRFLGFDGASGLVTAEAGATIAEILETFVPRGWFPPVTPGTKHVTLGGCVAADVHGKNHHRDGTFGAHVREITLALADGTLRHCSPESDSELFWATVGGMGLTGIILEVTLRLARIESAYLIVQHHAARDLDEAFELLEGEAWDEQTSMAWVDGVARGARLGRSIVMRGHHARLDELPARIRHALCVRPRRERNLPFDLLGWALHPAGVACFNSVYAWWQGRKKGPCVTHYDPYFYPLDSLSNWNRAYGKKGFTQYQCVLPSASAHAGLREILEAMRAERRSAYLAVLKRFGPEGPGLLSFPMAGHTLALDFPLSDPGIFPFLDRLDAIVLAHGGRVYLAKDVRLSPENFRAMYTRFDAWRRVKKAVDPEDRFASDLSRRLKMGASR